MNIIFLEPGFPANQREFVRALHSIGAHVLGVGDRPYDWLDDELKSWLGGYQQIESVTDEGALEWAVRHFQAQMWIDRLEAVIEAHVMPAAHVRERCSIPGISARTAYLCRDKVAMKEVLRKAGVPTAASAGVTSPAEAKAFVEAVGFPVIIKPRDAAGASGTYRADNSGELDAAARASGLADGAPAAIEEFVEGHEGFYDTLTVNGRVACDFVSHYYPNVLEAMRTRWISPQIVATNRIARAGLRRGQGDGRAGDRGARHRHLGHPHGVVLRAEGPALLRDRLPPAGRRPVGQLLRRQRVRPLPRMGARGLPRRDRPRALAPLRLRHHRAPPRPRRARSPATRARARSSTTTATWWSAATSPRPAPRPKASRRATWPTPGCGVRHPDYDELRRILNEIGERVQVRAG